MDKSELASLIREDMASWFGWGFDVSSSYWVFRALYFSLFSGGRAATAFSISGQPATLISLIIVFSSDTSVLGLVLRGLPCLWASTSVASRRANLGILSGACCSQCVLPFFSSIVLLVG